MVFSSITFLLYFLPVVFLVYYVFSFSRVLQNIWLLLASLVFYAWGEPVYVILLVVSILFNYGFGIAVRKGEDGGKGAKVALVLACIFNIGLLGVFKYTGFIVELVNDFLGEQRITDPGIPLPIGISFYTFQALSYVIDVYRGDADCQKNPFYLALYVAFFPQLIAGPIVRYSSVEKQIRDRKFDPENIATGICRFCEGFLKKILLANNLAVVADMIFDLTTHGTQEVQVPVLLSWLGAFAYSLQIFYDFSAYSDMAIGLGRMFGFDFQENFRYPFVSKSMREFMTRWHISLAAWFSQYVYKPLGGSRGGNKDNMVRNLFIVWLLTGIWHGAAWTFMLWGLYYFVFILLETVFQLDRVEGFDGLRHVYVIIAVMFSMVIFRSDSTEQMVVYFKDMFGLNGNGFYSPYFLMLIKENLLVFVASILCALPLKDYFLDRFEGKSMERIVSRGVQVLYVVCVPLLMFYCIAVLAKGSYNPFIYFNF